VTWITPGELTHARAAATATLTGTAVIHAQTSTSDGAGGSTEGFTPGPPVACRIAPVGGGETSAAPGGRVDDRTTHIITLPAGTTLTAKDRAVISGLTYEITAVRRRTNDITLRAEAREL